MNEPDSTSGKPVTVPTRPRKRKASTPRAPRVVDPAIAAIRAETTAKVKAYRNAQSSAKILKTIIDKRLAQLTSEDRNKLADALRGNTTPALIPTQP